MFLKIVDTSNQRWTITEKDIKKRNRVCSKHRVDANLDNKVV